MAFNCCSNHDAKNTSAMRHDDALKRSCRGCIVIGDKIVSVEIAGEGQ